MIQLRHYDPLIPAFAALQPYIDVRRGSSHPLAWRGRDYLDELRATYRRDRGIFALVRESGVVVMGCGETLPVLAGCFGRWGGRWMTGSLKIFMRMMVDGGRICA